MSYTLSSSSMCTVYLSSISTSSVMERSLLGISLGIAATQVRSKSNLGFLSTLENQNDSKITYTFNSKINGAVLITSMSTQTLSWMALWHCADNIEPLDRKSVVQGKSVDLGGRRIIKKKNKKKHNTQKKKKKTSHRTQMNTLKYQRS